MFGSSGLDLEWAAVILWLQMPADLLWLQMPICILLVVVAVAVAVAVVSFGHLQLAFNKKKVLHFMLNSGRVHFLCCVVGSTLSDDRGGGHQQNTAK